MNLRKLLLFLGLNFALISHALALPSTEAKPMDRDPMGVWRKSRSFENVSRMGAKVVFFPEENNFFAYWVPPNYRSGRVMVAIHGTGGNPYEELKDEIPMAEEFDYLVVAVNWFSPKKGYFKARDLYRNILEALDYVKGEAGIDLDAVGYIGFSRGGAISYEVAYLDAQDEKIFDLFIAHSGGIPEDFKVEARNPGAAADAFFSNLAQEKLGPNPLEGTKFFLYSGDKDESWGLRMSRQMDYASTLITRNGGQVVEWVRKPDGSHAGLRMDRSINRKAVRHFIKLTSV
jgi:predicted esterase